MPWLELNGNPRELTEGETIVGGGPQAGWRLQGVDLRPRHLVFWSGNDGVVTVRPFSVQDVITVNGKQVAAEPHVLNDGDVIAAGSGFFDYSVGLPRHRELAPLLPPVGYLVDEGGKKAFPLNHASTGIGRDPSNLVLLQESEASRFHAEVRREAGGFALHASGSAGTRLNGQPISAPSVLEEGDRIQIASRALRFTHGPLSPQLTATLESAVMDAHLSRFPAGMYARRPEPPTAPGHRPSRRRAILGIAALLVLLAVVVAILR